MQSEYLADLNPAQKEAVCFGEGPILVLAGAGSGKTRVLTSRVAHLVFAGKAAEEEILAVTFTNKAAGEMRQRVQELLGKGWLSCQISTFHSFCTRVLREHIDVLGHWNTRFTIYDRGDQKALIRSILKELHLTQESYPIPLVISRIAGLKKQEISSDEFSQNTPHDPIAAIYSLYTRKCIEYNALDFDDLIFCTIRIFSRNPGILESYQKRFHYVLVDEFQDTTPFQYRLIKMLGAPQNNILVVGDDDQSIYRFRGVVPDIFEEFKQDFPKRHLVKLEENYRSTQIILDAANHVIAKNSGRVGKNLWTKLGEGDKILVLTGEDEREEARRIVSFIKKIAKENPYGEIAILYRANAQSRPLEEVLKISGIPYRIIGGTRFYERKEIKDILAFLILIDNPHDEMAFRRVVNFPHRGIGEKTITRLEEVARQFNTSLFTASEAIIKNEPASALAKKLTPIAKIFSDLPLESSVTDVAEELVTRAGIRQYYQKNPSPESQARLDNIEEFFSATQEFDNSEPEGGVSQFLEQVRLISDADAVLESGAVTLMTVHCAKGLEFPVIIVAGMEEGIFPIAQSLGDPEQSEEERRLFYVAITRSQKHLALSCCQRRMIYGHTRAFPQSRFLRDIPSTLIKYDSPQPVWADRNYRKQSISPTAGRPEYPQHQRIKAPEIPPKHTFDKKYKLGKRVFHPMWGNGRIAKVEGQGEDMNLVVDFSSGTRRKLKAKYAHLALI
jgi:DNA helicase-2/ATP-dependent DNA helicase PcrA